MTAHNRGSLRKDMPLRMLINYDLEFSKVQTVKDISLEGAFLEGGQGELPQGAKVEAVLRYRVRGRPVEHRLPANVVRVDENGVALKFGDYDDETYTGLANLLYAYSRGHG